jgi:hypothetical protein
MFKKLKQVKPMLGVHAADQKTNHFATVAMQ